MRNKNAMFLLTMFSIKNAKIRNVKVGNKPHVLFDDGAENAELATTIDEVVNKVTANFKAAIMENIPKGAVISYTVTNATENPAAGTRHRRTKEEIAADKAKADAEVKEAMEAKPKSAK